MANRADIIEAAAALFREQGYHNTSMADIAGRVGVL
jgi:AcrR family transcriptional regulator